MTYPGLQINYNKDLLPTDCLKIDLNTIILDPSQTPALDSTKFYLTLEETN